jgi:hypothetical protein
MASKRDETIVAVSEYLAGIREDRSAERVYMYLFDSGNPHYSHSGGATESLQLVTVHDGTHIDAVGAWKEFDPRGGTPLYDAVGTVLERLVGNRMFVVVLTDGQENTSREYSRDSVKALIEQKEALGWDFIFLGASFDAWGGNARALGIMPGKTLTYTGPQTQSAWAAARNATSSYHTTGERLPDDHFVRPGNDYHEGYFEEADEATP